MLSSVIIGCGRIAGLNAGIINENTHAGAYAYNHSVNLVGCVDKDYQKAIDLSELHKCRAFNNISEALGYLKPDIVSVCTPDNTHFEITKNLLLNNPSLKVIFLEKPACVNQRDFVELLDLCKESNVSIVVNHTRRFDEHHQILRQRILNNEFGELIRCNTDYYGGWKHNGVHLIDTLYYLFDDEIKTFKITGELNGSHSEDPTIEMVCKFENKNGIIYVSGVLEEYYQLFEFDLRFSRARLKIEDFGSRIILENKIVNEIGESVLQIVDNGLAIKKKSAMQNAVDLIVKSVLENDKEYLKGYTLKDIYTTMKTIWKAEDEYKFRFK